MDSFKGKYERTSADKVEDLLLVLEVNFLLRKAASVSTPVMEVSKVGGDWTIKTSTTLKTIILGPFEIGKKFDETTPDGREVSTTVFLEGHKFVQEQTAETGVRTCTTVRDFKGDEIVQTITVDGIDDLVCIQAFKRIA